MRLISLFLLAALALLQISCTPEDPFTSNSCSRIEQHQGAFLRVVHGAPDGPAVSVFVGESQIFSRPQTFLGFQNRVNEGKYYPIDGGTQMISFLQGDVSVADTTVNLVSRKYYTAYFYGTGGQYHVLVTEDAVDAPPDKAHSKYRIVHLSPDAGVVDIIQFKGTDRQNVAEDLAFGTASAYFTGPIFNPGDGPGLSIVNALDPSKEIYAIPEKYILLPGEAVFTIVMTGSVQPPSGQPFIFFSAMQENAIDEQTCLYGLAPLRVEFAAVRAVNLMPTGPAGAEPQYERLDFSIYDANPKYRANSNFRREITLSHKQILQVYSLQHRPVAAYFLLSTLLRTSYPYRVEMHGKWPDGTDSFYYGYQTPVATGPVNGGIQLLVKGNKRYTLAAFGPYEPGKGRSVVLTDDNPTIPGRAAVRFFHGAYDFGTTTLQGKRLRLRVKGTTQQTPLMGYGDTVSGTGGVLVTDAGAAVPFEVVDESGQVVYEQNVAIPSAGFPYTIFLFPGADGDRLMLVAVKEDFTTA